MSSDIEKMINSMLEEVLDVRAIPDLRKSDVEKEVVKRILKLLEKECSDEI